MKQIGLIIIFIIIFSFNLFAKDKEIKIWKLTKPYGVKVKLQVEKVSENIFIIENNKIKIIKNII